MRARNRVLGHGREEIRAIRGVGEGEETRVDEMKDDGRGRCLDYEFIF